MSKDLIKENIISESIQLFMKYGLRSVTMDDIARHMGISKKTIYQHFKDKEDIIIQTSETLFKAEVKIMEDIEKESENAVDHLYKQTLWLRERIKNTSTTALYDMKKYYHNAWSKYKCYKHEVIYNSVIRNLNRGIKEGLFRAGINPEILALIRIGQIELSFDKNVFPENKFTLVEIHEQLFEHFTHGILSEKGLELFKSYKKKNNLHEAV
ncbi:MAG: TetR/AcrR family transcriptional regulator [Cytophagales bacterium]|nr:TetR/AcrR family transcriptional regulator [Cytophagales bacterium]